MSNASRCCPQVEEVEVVDQIIAGLFTIPKLMGPLRNQNVTDILVFGSAPVRVEELDGSVTESPPLVSRDRDLERIIYDVAVQAGRPFNIENHEVDFELEPGVRFHAGGFDPVQRPYIAIRRAALFGAALDELYDRGAADAGIVELLRAGVAAGLGIVFVGPMGSGKTTWLRATIAEIDASTGDHHDRIRLRTQRVTDGQAPLRDRVPGTPPDDDRLEGVHPGRSDATGDAHPGALDHRRRGPRR